MSFHCFRESTVIKIKGTKKEKKRRITNTAKIYVQKPPSKMKSVLQKKRTTSKKAKINV